MKDSRIFSLFPEAVVYVSQIDVDKNKVIEQAKQTSFKRLIDGEGCYMSDTTMVFDDLPFVRDEAKKHVENYIRKIMFYNMDFKFLNSWFSKTEPKGHSIIHSHNNSFLSGVYYPEGSEGFTISFFKKADPFWSLEVDVVNDLNAIFQTLTISNDNTLILFPSNLRHKIDVNKSDKDRYSLAFNINPSGFIGGRDGRVFF